MTEFSTSDLGQVFLDKHGEPWVLRSICVEPSVEFVKCSNGEKTGLVGIHGLTAQCFHKPTPDEYLKTISRLGQILGLK